MFYIVRGRVGRLISVLILLLLVSIFPLFSDIQLSLIQWNLGKIEADLSYIKELEIENRGTEPVRVSLMSTCGCLSVDPQEIILEPNAKSIVKMIFDSSDDTGEFEKIIIIRTTNPDLPKAFFMVRGDVIREVAGQFLAEGRGEGSDEQQNPLTEDLKEDPTLPMADSDETLELRNQEEMLAFDYYYSPSCKECREFLAHSVPQLSEKLGKNIIVNGKDIQDPLNYEDLFKRLTTLGVESLAFPVIIFNNRVIQGEREIEKELENLLENDGSLLETEASDARNVAEKNHTGPDLRIFPIFLAGLLDGVNPCAFTTLIFLLTALAVAGRSRREILVIGLFFTFSVYITYYFVGVGFFGVIRMADSFSMISIVIKWLLVTVLLVFAVLSILDFFKIKKNRASEIILQLPKGMKKRIHKSVRTYSRSTALAGSSILMGFLVSIFELGCTGQIYFPTITYMIKTKGSLSGYFMLALYNFAFILPLLLIFFITYRGVSSDKVTAIFQKNLGAVKLFTAVLFIVLAVITILN
ncbi:MAG: DUF1573 domain-containing protein [Spirochaetales bacterium]|nr:DUF1573 domain-containing protein [Spirochaetales bacterium]